MPLNFRITVCRVRKKEENILILINASLRLCYRATKKGAVVRSFLLMIKFSGKESYFSIEILVINYVKLA